MAQEQASRSGSLGRGILLAALVVVFTFALCGCGDFTDRRAPGGVAGEAVETVSPVTDVDISPDDESPIAGRWEVVDYRLTPVAAMDEAEASDFLGRVVVYSERAAGFDEEPCMNPNFDVHAEPFADYFRDFEVDPAEFEIETPEVDVIDVRCAGEAWSAPGAELIHIRGDSIVVVYDGMFLSVEPY